MSKIINVYYRKGTPNNIEEKLLHICRKLEPDNITANLPKIVSSQYLSYGIINPMATILYNGNNVLLGQTFEKNNELIWNSDEVKFPDGSYALFRDTKDKFVATADAVASRTIWYFFDEEKLISSTSQRAIILFLGSYEPNSECIPWVLSTGSLGPSASWDKRIKRIPPASSLVLDKDTWKIKLEQNDIVFKHIKDSRKNYRRKLSISISQTFEQINFDLRNWVLPLSGGYDSRGILYFLIKKKLNTKPRTITWGLEQSQNIIGNDAYVAKKISKTLGIPHKYYHTDLSNEPMKTILDRFIIMGEGRIDHIGGYMDGFNIWKTLFEDNVQGVIRGDEGFGWSDVSTKINVRYYNGCALCGDFENLRRLCNKYGLKIQDLPSELQQLPSETLSSWRDRIYHQFRLPTVLSALSDLKLGYVEQTTPLLSYKILNVVRGLPDGLRTEKKLFKKIIDSLEPKIEYANKGANADPGQILKHPEVVAILQQELKKEDVKELFPNGFIDDVLSKTMSKESLNKKRSKKQKFIAFAKRNIPKFLKNMILSNTPLNLDYNVLAFRIYIIVYMNRLLKSETQFN
ncbi:asparagine synthetase B family protein [Pseudozobellia thermophila]|uniref:Asparagine synthase (Glutamine-hydrolysing) n=1 Tax=Pseudozobellia thermophila TaxID=192903 RepID=A0A1M6IW85_9FLAO|nr:hypothetical protein [Pseudozobellia thermophila]SHJ38698.1 hypothetical protein SAMN04488513_104143 [Pseudozobellia thermophila]